MVLCLLILLVMAAVMAGGTIPAWAVSPMAIGAAAVSSLAGGWVASRLSRERGLLYGAATGLLLFLLTVAAGFTLLQGLRDSVLLVKLAMMVVAGAVGGILGVNSRRR